MAYMRQLEAEHHNIKQSDVSSTCFLCDAATTQPHSDDARERLIIDVTADAVVLLNRYPYTNGHLLIAPRAHVASLSDLSACQRASLMELTERCERLLRLVMHCQGLNVGMNIGQCAGAGVPGHMHIHVLPRWGGDTNFMQTVGQVRVCPQALEESHAMLAAGWAALARERGGA